MTKIKICGVTRAENAAMVAGSGVDFIGLNFWPSSKRYLPAERAAEVAAAARERAAIQIVGVFADASVQEIVAVCSQVELDAIQLHGDESPELANQVSARTGLPVWKAIPGTNAGAIQGYDEMAVEVVVLDTPSEGKGGSGVSFDWGLARTAVERFPERRIMLAGGLTAANVADAIAGVTPWAVDVSSGVEAEPGVKDPDRISAFVAAVRSRA